mmetsp:Transcript_3189/g.7601  ORF Transcript_3189/g.7601 Transcript_3189/m.7601 type:complete len:218 (-) Transcript_3189:2-655(-)
MLDQRLLVQVRVTLHLQDCRLDPGEAHDLVNLLTVEIGKTNRLDQTLINKLLKLPPRLLEWYHIVLHAAILILGHVLLLLIQLEAHRPVNQVQVQIVQFQGLQRLHQRRLHILRMVPCVPQLAGDKNFLPCHTGGHGRLQPFTDLIFIAVHKSSVDVPVSHLDRMLHSGLHLTRLGLPRAQAQQRHLGSGVQGGAHGRSHGNEVLACKWSSFAIKVT